MSEENYIQVSTDETEAALLHETHNGTDPMICTANNGSTAAVHKYSEKGEISPCPESRVITATSPPDTVV